MQHLTFEQYVRVREGLLAPDRPPAPGLSRTNPFPTTNAHRRRLRARVVSPPDPFGPTVRPVPEVVPQKIIPRPNPPGPRGV
ncbi:MAG: hypothetical protein C0501_29625 [Isosphaera sp.]|nr:hypothetical protein [Isosphaera sp.]